MGNTFPYLGDCCHPDNASATGKANPMDIPHDVHPRVAHLNGCRP